MNNQELIGKKVPVLDQGWIELQDVMGDDLAIVNAARTSYLGESKGEAADKKLLFYLMKNKHTTPFEMVEFKFRVYAPVVVWWQWVRHRTFSFNAQSGRYTPFEEDSFYKPDIWRIQEIKNKQGSSGEVDNNRLWIELFDQHCKQSFNLYERALSIGIGKEQARLFLPGFALYYTWICKVDAHNLLHFLKLRMDNHAQYEIRQYAIAIWQNFFKPALPWTAEAAITCELVPDD